MTESCRWAEGALEALGVPRSGKSHTDVTPARLYVIPTHAEFWSAYFFGFFTGFFAVAPKRLFVNLSLAPQYLQTPVAPILATILPLHFGPGQGYTLVPTGRAMVGFPFVVHILRALHLAHLLNTLTTLTHVNGFVKHLFAYWRVYSIPQKSQNQSTAAPSL